HAICLVRQIGRVVRRQHLLPDPGGVHQFQPALNILGRIRNRMTGDPPFHRDAYPRRKAVAHECEKLLWIAYCRLGSGNFSSRRGRFRPFWYRKKETIRPVEKMSESPETPKIHWGSFCSIADSAYSC